MITVQASASFVVCFPLPYFHPIPVVPAVYIAVAVRAAGEQVANGRSWYRFVGTLAQVLMNFSGDPVGLVPHRLDCSVGHHQQEDSQHSLRTKDARSSGLDNAIPGRELLTPNGMRRIPLMTRYRTQLVLLFRLNPRKFAGCGELLSSRGVDHNRRSMFH